MILFSLLSAIGVSGLFMNRKNVITILMSVELILLAVNINFVASSVHLQDIVGQIFSIIVLSIAAAEVSIGLPGLSGLVGEFLSIVTNPAVGIKCAFGLILGVVYMLKLYKCLCLEK